MQPFIKLTLIAIDNYDETMKSFHDEIKLKYRVVSV